MSQYKYFAKVYDRMMDNIPYEGWRQYLLQIMYRFRVKPGAAVTEIGCGTGIMTRLLREDGFRMTGVDLSEEMLEIAKEKEHVAATVEKGQIKSAAEKNQTEAFLDEDAINYLHMDMRELVLPEKQDVIFGICDSMNYLLSVDDLAKCFKAVRDNLKDGGIIIFDLKTDYFYRYMLADRTFSEKMKGFSYVWKNRYDEETKIHTYLLYIRHKDGKKIVEEKEIHRQRAFSAEEIKEAALQAGFKKAAVFGEGSFDKPRIDSERIFICLRK